MTPLTDIRAEVQRDLRDETALVWTANEIDRAILRAVNEYSLYKPRPQLSTIATTPDSREVDISTLTDRIGVYKVEFPLSYDPPSYQRFHVFINTLYLDGDDVGNGNNCKIAWGKLHTIDGSTNSIETQDHELVCLGAAAYAALAAGVAAVNTVNVGGQNVDRDYKTWGQDALRRFLAGCKRVKRGMTIGRLVSEALTNESGA